MLCIKHPKSTENLEECVMRKEQPPSPGLRRLSAVGGQRSWKSGKNVLEIVVFALRSIMRSSLLDDGTVTEDCSCLETGSGLNAREPVVR